MKPEFVDLKLEQPEQGVWLLTLDRPKAMNALNTQVLLQMQDALSWLETQAGIRVLLITGSGHKAFVAGADIAAMKDMDALQARSFSNLGMKLMHRIENLPIPVIALVNGYCLGGGCELAMSCDFIIASDRAVFGQPEVSLGIPPGFGGTQRMVRRVGRANAVQLLMSGEHINAQEAYRIGLANKVTPQDQLMTEGMEQAKKIRMNAPKAVSFAKELANTGSNLDIKHGCQMETELFALSFSTSDQKEGMTAFTERRPAKFTGC